MIGLPLPKEATKAVGISATPRSTVKPSRFQEIGQVLGGPCLQEGEFRVVPEGHGYVRRSPFRASTAATAVAFSGGSSWDVAFGGRVRPRQVIATRSPEIRLCR